MDDLVFRVGDKGDVNDIVTLVESVYRGENSKRGWTTEAELLDGQRTDEAMIREMMDDGASVFLLAREPSGKLLASVWLQRQPTYGYLGMLSVDVQAQNRRLGRRMIDAGEALVKNQWKLNEMRIRVIDVRHSLIEWYERRGYRFTGATSAFDPDPRFGVSRVGPLTFKEMAKIL